MNERKEKAKRAFSFFCEQKLSEKTKQSFTLLHQRDKVSNKTNSNEGDFNGQSEISFGETNTVRDA